MIPALFHKGDWLHLEVHPHADGLFQERHVIVVGDAITARAHSHVLYNVYDIHARELTQLLVPRDRQDKDWKKIA